MPRPERRMPNIKSAKKRMGLSAVARAKNRSERARIRTAIKKVQQAESAEGDPAKIQGTPHPEDQDQADVDRCEGQERAEFS